MRNGTNEIPVIDLFAGPGGLSEGFASYEVAGHHPFDISLSVEMDPEAHRTLKLRSFLRRFPLNDILDPYAEFLKTTRTDADQASLYSRFPSQSQEASNEALCLELGSDGPADRAFALEVGKRIRDRKAWVLIGGPPCQAYSLVGRARRSKEDRTLFEADKKHRLYKHYLRILAEFRPPVFVMENVKGMLSSTLKGHRILEQMLEDLQQPSGRHGIKYRLLPFVETAGRLYPNMGVSGEEFIIRCEEYGIPQARHRVIILGIDDRLDATPRLLDRKPQVTLREVIGDCPPLRSGVSRSDDTAENWADAIRAIRECRFDSTMEQIMASALGGLRTDCSTGEGISRYSSGRPSVLVSQWYRRWQLGLLVNHETRRHIPADLRRYFFAACFAEATLKSGKSRSPKLGDFPGELLPKHKNIDKEAPDNSVFSDRFRVQTWDRPATTVTAHIAKDGHYFIHPDPTQCRSLTVREAARVQTFPDDYAFLGTRTGQYRQVGNAVPPLLAVRLAETVHDILLQAGRLRM